MSSKGKRSELALSRLRLDPNNPRLPDDLDTSNQDQLLKFIEANYDPITIARSIVEHGFFASEPLIVVKEGSSYIVVEGNRRLTALKLLSDESCRALLEKRRRAWDELAEKAELDDEYPVIIADTWDDVAPIIGYRHISGIEPWDPLPKARFISDMVDEKNHSFAEVADLVGESETVIRALYRNLAVLKQAQDLGLETKDAEDHFSILTNALGRRPIVSFIGAPPPREVDPEFWPVDEDRHGELRELFSWMFGDAKRHKVIAESRDLKMLASVLESSDAVEVLRETRDLEAADEAAGGPLVRLIRRLSNARNALRAAREDIEEFAEEDSVEALLDECEELLQELRTQE